MISLTVPQLRKDLFHSSSAEEGVNSITVSYLREDPNQSPQLKKYFQNSSPALSSEIIFI
jgi:hypothetical protein